MQLELKPITIDCPRCFGRRSSYIVLDNAQIVYVYPPVDEGKPGFVSAVSVGCAIVAVTKHEQIDPAASQHFVLLTGLDTRFVGQYGFYHYCRVMLAFGSGGPYAPLGGFFAVEPLICPESVLVLCRDWLGEKPIQVTAKSGDWVLPPKTE